MRKMPEHFQAKFSRQRRIDDGHAPHWKECDCDGRCQWHHGAVEGSIKLRPRHSRRRSAARSPVTAAGRKRCYPGGPRGWRSSGGASHRFRAPRQALSHRASSLRERQKVRALAKINAIFAAITSQSIALHIMPPPSFSRPSLPVFQGAFVGQPRVGGGRRRRLHLGYARFQMGKRNLTSCMSSLRRSTAPRI
jgi:hypothetical protein